MIAPKAHFLQVVAELHDKSAKLLHEYQQIAGYSSEMIEILTLQHQLICVLLMELDTIPLARALVKIVNVCLLLASE